MGSSRRKPQRSAAAQPQIASPPLSMPPSPLTPLIPAPSPLVALQAPSDAWMVPCAAFSPPQMLLDLMAGAFVLPCPLVPSLGSAQQQQQQQQHAVAGFAQVRGTVGGGG